jgi:vanillate O-demethylase ferredoxin subunit
MAWRLHELGRDFTWHLSARSRSRLPWANRLDLLPFGEKIKVHLDDGSADQLFDAAEAVHDLPTGIQIYICGPSGYMNHLAKAASDAGVPRTQLRQEHFGAEIDVNGDPFTVIAARSGIHIQVSANETILAAVTRNGLKVETACRNGVCGGCLTRVLEGRPDHRDMVLTDSEKAENNRIALCCSRSQSAVLVIDL